MNVLQDLNSLWSLSCNLFISYLLHIILLHMNKTGTCCSKQKPLNHVIYLILQLDLTELPRWEFLWFKNNFVWVDCKIKGEIFLCSRIKCKEHKIMKSLNWEEITLGDERLLYVNMSYTGKVSFWLLRGKVDREFWFKFLRLDRSIKGFAENLHNLWTWLLFLWKIRQNIFAHIYILCDMFLLVDLQLF